jgi:hypothetical protein
MIIIHPLVEIGQLAQAVGKAGTALIEYDHLRSSRQMVQPAGLVRRVPGVLDVRNEARDDDDGSRTIAEDLIRDMYIAAFSVANFRRH